MIFIDFGVQILFGATLYVLKRREKNCIELPSKHYGKHYAVNMGNKL